MILNGNQHGGAKDLALHLMKSENEVVEIHELRGFLSRDLMGALNEMYAVSRGTKCKQFMYSLSLNPPKNEKASIADFERAIEEAEQRLGLQGQSRAVVFHEKNGRRHAHVVWSRIDLESMTARQMSHDHKKLTALSRELFLHHGWDMPNGLKNSKDRDPTNYTHAEHQQAKRVGKHAALIKRELQDAWAISDTKEAFEHALAEYGYFLARGTKGRFVAVDMEGEVYPIPKQLGIKTKEVRARLGDGDDLPSVEHVLEHVAKLRAEQALDQDAEKPKTKAKDITALEALERVTRFHAAFTDKMMDRTLKPIIKNDEKLQSLINTILASNEIVKIGEKNGRNVFTTQAMLDLEQSMIQLAQVMAQTSSHVRDEHAVYRAVYSLNAKLSAETGGTAQLSQEQISTLHDMTSDKQLSLVVGVAGAGKTTIMQGAKEVLESQGYRVRGAAPSGIAASGLQDIDMNASTLHSLEARIRLAREIMDNNTGRALSPKQMEIVKSGTLTSKDVLIIDESGMVPTKQLANIIHLTQQAGAKLILVGDHQQLQSIEAGTAFKNLLERNEYAELTEVRRQKIDWQMKATKQLSKGNISEALGAYEKQHCLHRSKNRSTAKEQLVADMMESYTQSPEKSRLVLAYTRKDVADLNTMIKAEMVARGKVQDIDTPVSITMRDGDTEFQQEQGFAIGDRILFRENNRDLGVMNGSFGTLQAIENGLFTVALDNGKTVKFSPEEYSRFQLGYAATVHKSQGITVDEAYVLATPHFDRHTTYVALSRHKENVKLYASNRDFKNRGQLYRELGKESEKLSTLDFTDPRKQQMEQPSSLKNRVFDGAKQLWQCVRRHKEQPHQPEQQDNLHSGRSTESPQYQKPQADQRPTQPLQQRDFIKLRDEFMQESATPEQQQPAHDYEQEQERDLER